MVSRAVPAPAELRVPAGEPGRSLHALTAVHVGQSALVLSALDGSGPLLVVGDARRGLVPFGLCVPRDADFAAVRAAVAAARGPVDLTAWARSRRTAVDLRLSPADADPVALLAMSRMLTTGDQGSGVHDPRAQRVLAAPLARAALRGNTGQVTHALLELVGAGPGATPAGDDVVVGVLAALTMLAGIDGTVPRARRLLVAELAPLLVRTTRASRQDLEAAAEGRFSEHAHVLVSALSDARGVSPAVDAARAWGATSGIDLATGLCAGACAVLAHVRGAQRLDAHLLDAHLLDRRPA